MKVQVSILFLGISFSGIGQMLFDHQEAMKVVRKGADMVYELKMDSAQYYADLTEEMLPDHPVVPAMEAFIILWQHIPVLKDTVFDTFNQKLLEVIQKSQDMGDQVDAVFFQMVARGLLAEYYADQGQYMKAFGEANKTYGLIKQGFDYVEEYPEFLFMVGLYNYFREAYPKKHPVYKPLLWFFMDGDMGKGIEQVRRATTESALSRVEAYVYLTYIYLRYEETPQKALDYSEELYGFFPFNPYVQAKYLETLAACEKYVDMPDSTLQSMIDSDRVYYRMVGHVYNGVKLEKTGDEQMADKHYQMAIGLGDQIPNFGHYYKSLAWLGRGRIASTTGDAEKAKDYLEKALAMAQTDEVENEAQEIISML